MTTNSENKYSVIEEDSKKYTDAILKSTSRKKIVVAGPGTGKTFLFKKILENKKNALTLTFVNTLVEDLSLELYGMSAVRTLHGYARSELSKHYNPIKIFPKLSEVIREDAKILLGEEINFDFIFHNRDDGNENIEFYRARRKYYDYYGFSDIVFALVRDFEKHKDRVPSYNQVLVDEFQDFNKLEISLIDLLSEKSPILLVGDDDQALYGDLKSANAKYIRDRFNDNCLDYESFTLPYCRRCTSVIVNAVNDIIASAISNDFLKSRANKKYNYFPHKNKDIESNKNPKIVYSQKFATQIPWFIEQQIKNIAEETKDSFFVLIIAPTKIQIRSIIESLKGKGFINIQSSEKKNEKEITLLDGLKVLLEDKASNLGWRIVSRCILSETDFKTALEVSQNNSQTGFSELIDQGKKKDVNQILKILRSIKNDKDVGNDELYEVLKKIGFGPSEIAKNYLKEEINSNSMRIGDPGLRKIPIQVTTIQGSKGLASDYVFIAYFDDRYFIKNKDKSIIEDNEICNFLVALTRARRKVFLISTDDKIEPTFLRWINKDRIERV